MKTKLLVFVLSIATISLQAQTDEDSTTFCDRAASDTVWCWEQK